MNLLYFKEVFPVYGNYIAISLIAVMSLSLGIVIYLYWKDKEIEGEKSVHKTFQSKKLERSNLLLSELTQLENNIKDEVFIKQLLDQWKDEEGEYYVRKENSIELLQKELFFLLGVLSFHINSTRFLLNRDSLTSEANPSNFTYTGLLKTLKEFNTLHIESIRKNQPGSHITRNSLKIKSDEMLESQKIGYRYMFPTFFNSHDKYNEGYVMDLGTLSFVLEKENISSWNKLSNNVREVSYLFETFVKTCLAYALFDSVEQTKEYLGYVKSLTILLWSIGENDMAIFIEKDINSIITKVNLVSNRKLELIKSEADFADCSNNKFSY